MKRLDGLIGIKEEFWFAPFIHPNRMAKYESAIHPQVD